MLVIKLLRLNESWKSTEVCSLPNRKLLQVSGTLMMTEEIKAVGAVLNWVTKISAKIKIIAHSHDKMTYKLSGQATFLRINTDSVTAKPYLQSFLLA